MIHLPERCLRDRADCEPLAQLAADDGTSFICCGRNAEREHPADRFRVCWKNDAVDEMGDWSERDIKDTLSVLAQALSVDVNMRGET